MILFLITNCQYGSIKIATPTYPENLPISHRRDELISAIKNNSVVIVSGQTGSGKTTQLPKFCLEAGCGKTGTIALTQPRRIAAIAAAKRIAQELHADNMQGGLRRQSELQCAHCRAAQTNAKPVLAAAGPALSPAATDRRPSHGTCQAGSEGQSRL